METAKTISDFLRISPPIALEVNKNIPMDDISLALALIEKYIVLLFSLEIQFRSKLNFQM